MDNLLKKLPVEAKVQSLLAEYDKSRSSDELRSLLDMISTSLDEKMDIVRSMCRALKDVGVSDNDQMQLTNDLLAPPKVVMATRKLRTPRLPFEADKPKNFTQGTQALYPCPSGELVATDIAGIGNLPPGAEMVNVLSDPASATMVRRTNASVIRKNTSLVTGGTRRMQPSKPMVLMADDDLRARMLVRLRLEEAGFILAECNNGSDAWLKLKNEHEDFVVAILDMKMPGMHGLDIIQQLDSAKISIPVIICSAYDAMEADVTLLRRPNCRYLVKPVPAERLLENIKDLMAATGKAPPVPVLK